jgi:hypothetical protein
VRYYKENDCKIGKNKLNSNFTWVKYFADYDPGKNDVWRGGEYLGIIFYEYDKRRKFRRQGNFAAGCFGAYYFAKETPYLTTRLEKSGYGSSSSWVQNQLQAIPLSPDYWVSDGGDFFASAKNF